MFSSRFWTRQGRWGVLLCPGDEGGQSITVRLGNWFFRLDADVWRRELCK